jgi:hypothetical protein
LTKIIQLLIDLILISIALHFKALAAQWFGFAFFLAKSFENNSSRSQSWFLS